MGVDYTGASKISYKYREYVVTETLHPHEARQETGWNGVERLAEQDPEVRQELPAVAIHGVKTGFEELPPGSAAQ
jgi:hypothetical protein